MYTIIKGLDGKYHCHGRLQDSTERWTEDTLKKAIKSMKVHAKMGNHTKIKKRDITYLQEAPVTKMEYIPWQP